MTKKSVSIRKIDWLSTTELIDELTERFDSLVFMGMRPEEGDSHGRLTWRASGNHIACRGLTDRLFDIVREEEGDFQETEDEEPT